MKYFLFSFILLTNSLTFAQELDQLDSAYIEVSDEQIYNYLNDSINNELSFGCGYSGESSYNLELFLMLSKRNRIDLIYSLRNSKINATKYIATEFIILANEMKLIQFSEEDTKNIKKLKKSTKEIEVCSGCDGYMKSDFRSLFNSESDFGRETRSTVKSWIEKYLK